MIPYSPVGFETHITMPPSSILGGSGIIDDGAGTLTGDVTARLLDNSYKGFGYDVGSKTQTLSSQGPVTGLLSLKATVIEHGKNKGIKLRDSHD